MLVLCCAISSQVPGRSLEVFEDDAAMSQQLVAEVTAAAKEAISKKGSSLAEAVWGGSISLQIHVSSQQLGRCRSFLYDLSAAATKATKELSM